MKSSGEMHVELGNRVRTSSSVIRLLLCLAGVAAMGVGTAAQQAPSVVRVDSGQLQGALEDGVVS